MILDFLTYIILGIAVGYLIKKFFFKQKSDINCNKCN